MYKVFMIAGVVAVLMLLGYAHALQAYKTAKTELTVSMMDSYKADTANAMAIVSQLEAKGY